VAARVSGWEGLPATRDREPFAGEYRAVGPAAWHWLAPAMAVFLLGIFVFGRPQAGLDGAFGMAWAVTPQERIYQAACSSTTHHSEANSPPVTMIESTFEWTNEGSSLEAPAPMGQTHVGQTNSPMQ